MLSCSEVRAQTFWGELFQDKLNFRIEYDELLAQHICRNRSPRQGEQSVYMLAGTTGATGDAYAVVAFLPNEENAGHILLIAGTNMEATEGAGEFVINPQLPESLRSIGINPAGAPRNFEILLRVKAVAGSPHQFSVVSYRF
jgi:hypothetical protein